MEFVQRGFAALPKLEAKDGALGLRALLVGSNQGMCESAHPAGN